VTLSQIVAASIFVATFTAILSERLHRTIAAMAGATVMLGAGMVLGF
jgi:Na+/H+ antiporter NhaD/arsenite permease-like protein